jgi:hypothetical protein
MFRHLVLCVSFVSILAAQTNRGSISGTVKDATGSVVPGASIVVTNSGTNETRRLVSSPIGSFMVPDLDPVTYEIAVEAQGFIKQRVNKVKVDTASVASVVITLQAGSVDTTITVSGDAVTINTESGTTSSTVTERQPLLGILNSL